MKESNQKTWVLRHPDLDHLAWGQSGDLVDHLNLHWVPLDEAQAIVSKYQPTYLNFIGSNSHAKQMKIGVVSEL